MATRSTTAWCCSWSRSRRRRSRLADDGLPGWDKRQPDGAGTEHESHRTAGPPRCHGGNASRDVEETDGDDAGPGPGGVAEDGDCGHEPDDTDDGADPCHRGRHVGRVRGEAGRDVEHGHDDGQYCGPTDAVHVMRPSSCVSTLSSVSAALLRPDRAPLPGRPGRSPDATGTQAVAHVPASRHSHDITTHAWTQRTSAGRWAAAVLLVTATGAVLLVSLVTQHRDLTASGREFAIWLEVLLTMIPLGVAGAMLIDRRPDLPFGWILAVGAVSQVLFVALVFPGALAI